MISLPYECNRCHHRLHADRPPMICPNCKFTKLSALVSICLLVPKEDEPTFPVVHTSGQVQSDDGGVASVVGQEWVTGCKMQTLPGCTTASPIAVTCKRCLEYIDSKKPLSLPEEPGLPGGNDDKLDMSIEDEAELGSSEDEAKALNNVKSGEPDKLP